MTGPMMRLRQRGAVTMLMALLVLVALALIGLTGTRLVMTQHRISANITRADAAFAAADAGIQNAMVYLGFNRDAMTDVHLGGWMDSSSSSKWRNCASTDTALPCGSGSGNLYGNTWSWYGPVPNQAAVGSTYTVNTWYLTNTLTATRQDIPYLQCTNLALGSLVTPATATTITTVNTLLGLLHAGSLPANLCLPVNFSQMPEAPWPSSANPSITIVSSATSTSDAAAGSAVIQQVAATTNLFFHLPEAALMVNGTVGLSGDIRIWGNPRPPTEAPVNFSLLNLNDILGLSVTSLMNSTVSSNAASIRNSLNVSFAPVLNVTSADVTAFSWNVTFPLAIWSASTTTLASAAVGVNILNSARTCDPPFPTNSSCVPLSESVSIPAGSVALLTPPVAVNLPLKLPDIQDYVNIASTATGLIGSSVPCFPGVTSVSCTAGLPATLFEWIFGYTLAQSSKIQQLATTATDCSAVGTAGLYWVTGNCSLSGSVGSTSAPLVIIASGNVTLASGTDFYGVIYLTGSGAKTLTGAASGSRPTIHGALLSEGALSGTGLVNVAYDINMIRAAGYRVTPFAPVPGGWNDAATGP